MSYQSVFVATCLSWARECLSARRRMSAAVSGLTSDRNWRAHSFTWVLRFDSISFECENIHQVVEFIFVCGVEKLGSVVFIFHLSRLKIKEKSFENVRNR